VKGETFIKEDGYKWLVFLAIGTGLFATVADAGSSIVALPTIARYFHTDLPTTQWVVVAYALTISALLVPMGRVSDMVGKKRIYLFGFLIFTTGAVAASMSMSISMLILSRVLMGVGTSMTQGPSMAMMISSFPASERGRALGFQMSAVGTGAVAGPALGGFIVAAFGWRAIFYATAGLGAVSLISASLILRPDKTDRRASTSSFDWPGAVLSATMVILFLLAVTSGSKFGWSSPVIIASFTGVVVLLAAFILWELRAKTPMLDVRYFKRRIFAVGVLSRFITFLGMSSVRYLLPFYVQSILGYSASAFGLMAVPTSLCMIFVAPVAGRLSDKYGWKKLTVGGMCVSVAGLLLLSALTVQSSVVFLIFAWVLQRLGHSSFSAPNNSSVLSVVEKEKFGAVAGFLNMVRNAGNVTGTALATAVVTSVMVSRGLPPTLEGVPEAQVAEVKNAFMTGMRLAYIIPAVLICIGAFLYSRVRAGTDK
jgi:EmrB/QacA subfamily drug resistance transporter